MVRSHESVRSLLRRVRTPHCLDQHLLGKALRQAKAASSSRAALIEIVEQALALQDPRLLQIVQRCDFSGEPTKRVAADLYLSPRQFFRYRATALEAIACEIERTLVAGEVPDAFPRVAGETIVRQWHGRVPRSKSDAYMRLMRDVSIPDYRSVPGNLGAYVLRQDAGDVTHIETLSMWVSEGAIERYAGAHVLRVKYYDFDDRYLLEFEEYVTHYRSAYGLAEKSPP